MGRLHRTPLGSSLEGPNLHSVPSNPLRQHIHFQNRGKLFLNQIPSQFYQLEGFPICRLFQKTRGVEVLFYTPQARGLKVLLGFEHTIDSRIRIVSKVLYFPFEKMDMFVSKLLFRKKNSLLIQF